MTGRRSVLGRALGRLLDLERPEVRRDATLVLLAAAIVSPSVALPGSLPAVRLEQVLLVPAVPALALYLARHREARRIGPIDVLFGALVGVIGVSIVLAPVLLPDVGRSLRDVFELLRPVEYWILYRLARTVEMDTLATRRSLMVVGAAGILTGLFALVQVLRPPSFNAAISSIWTTGHNLDVLVRAGRATATAGNPNVFGLLVGFLFLVAGGAFAMRTQRSRVGAVAWLAALGLSSAALVFTQSRSAALTMFGMAILAVIVVLVSRRDIGPLLLAGGVAASFAAFAFVILVAHPPPASTVSQRFNPGTIADQSSVVVRLARLRYVFADGGPKAERNALCGTPPGTPAPGHEPRSAAAAAAPTAAQERDAQRKAAIVAIARAIEGVYCRTGTWPTGPLASVLSEAGFGSVPRDPSTGRPYDVTLTATGYTAAARLEDTADADGPVYAIGSALDLVLDPSFEASSSAWQAAAETTIESGADGLYGQKAASVVFGDSGGYIDHFVIYTLQRGHQYSAVIRARSTTGAAQRIQMSATGWLTDGGTIDPMASASVGLPADGRWVPLQLTFTAPKQQVWVTQLLLRPAAAGVGGSIELDAASLNAGPVLSFGALRDVDPALLPASVPSFRDSPIIGAGPMNNYQFGAFDDEYLLILVRFGILGVLAYVGLFLAVVFEGWRTWRARQDGGARTIALAMAAGTIAMLVFNAAAGSYYTYQVMAIYWLLAGLVVAARLTAPAADASPGPGATG